MWVLVPFLGSHIADAGNGLRLAQQQPSGPLATSSWGLSYGAIFTQNFSEDLESLCQTCTSQEAWQDARQTEGVPTVRSKNRMSLRPAEPELVESILKGVNVARQSDTCNPALHRLKRQVVV